MTSPGNPRLPEVPADLALEARIARGAAIRLALVAALWGFAAGKLGLMGLPWALEPGGSRTVWALAIGTVLGAAQGWGIASRAGPRLLRWTREGAVSRRRDVVIAVRGVLVIALFAGVGRLVRWKFRESRPEVAGAVYWLASFSLVVATVALVRLAWQEARRARRAASGHGAFPE